MKTALTGWVLPVLGFFLIGFATANAAEAPKLGYFVMQKVVEQSKAGQEMKGKLDQEKEKLKGELEQKWQQYKQAKESLEKLSASMDEATKLAKEKQIQQVRQENEKLAADSTTRYKTLSNELATQVTKNVSEVVQKIGESEKYDYIFEAGRGGVFYAGDKDDLTKRVVEELDKMPAAPAK